jgi:circadian clock protein KaiC
MSTQEFVQRLARLTSGVTGLDRVLEGGFFVGGVYIVEGVPGAGKTVLANQLAFHHARHGNRVLYITMLAESHARLLQHLQDMSFFDPSAIPERLTYVSGFRSLEEGGLKSLLELIRRELRAKAASLVVLDGFVAASESAESTREFKKFVYELQVHAMLASSTFFILSSGVTGEVGAVQPVHTMVDGLIRLDDRLIGMRARRELSIPKFRGSSYLRGSHAFDIDDDGIRVYPRLESLEGGLEAASAPAKVPIGIPHLDAMLGGGLRGGSITAILGPTGVGKTTVGYRFLACSTAHERGLLFSFYETPMRALAKARGVGLDLAAQEQRGEIELIWRSPVELSLDALGALLLEAVDRVRPARLFVDGLNALLDASGCPERVPQFFAALGRELCARAVTTVYSAELHDVFAPQIRPPVAGVSAIIENLLLMRFVESDAALRRVISIVKARESDFDPGIREFVITSRGLDVKPTLGNKEGILTGVAHEKSDGGDAGERHKRARVVEPAPKKRRGKKPGRR